MYRQPARPTIPPTLIEYRSQRVRPWFFLIALALMAMGLGLVTSLHATHLTCTRALEDGSATCTVRRYGLIGALDVDIPLADIASFDVRVLKGSKGSSYAEVRLFMTPQSGGRILALETGAWGHVDPQLALDARSRFMAFRSAPKASGFDAWLTLSPLGNLFMALGAVAFGAGAAAILREQLGQLRPIRIVVDHDRLVVIVRRNEIPFSEIEHVKVEHGRALFWSSGRHEHVPGFRIVLGRRNAPHLPVTREFRAGPMSEHERARSTLLRAIGGAPHDA